MFKQLSNLRNASQSEFSPSKIDWPKEMSDELESSFEVINDFINEAEESDLMKEVEPHLKRLVYEKDHWDEAIVGFRETERKQWNQVNSVIIDKLRKAAFKPNDKYLPYVHVLDLAEDGHIKPHIDSPRVKLLFSSFARNIDKKSFFFQFCGDTVAVLSLLSDSVMKLVHEESKKYQTKYLIPRRSLYIMRYVHVHERELLKTIILIFRGSSRYDFTHEILANEDSVINDQKVIKTRRISIVCRNECV